MRVLFATAELTPLARAGGLGEAAGGLVAALRAAGITVDVVLPDYSAIGLADERPREVSVPDWARPASARRGRVPGVGDVTLINVPGIARPHPYIDQSGEGWADNDARFFAFSAAVANLVATSEPDVVHLNDWHTAAALAFMRKRPPTAFTVHTLGYQGWAGAEWLARIPYNFSAFERHGVVNPLAGAIQVADRVIAVSPTYADEIRRPESGMGLDAELLALGDSLVGIRNGIDTSIWDPAVDDAVATNYTKDDLTGKDVCRAELIATAGWDDDRTPLVGMVTRLVEQKGIDLALEAVRFAERLPYKLVLLGSGEQRLADWARWAATTWPNNVFFEDGYNQKLAHSIFAGSDLLLMPSRFEPCGLAQMQAMAYGTIPVVTDVGGLHDTVIDSDADRKNGTGFLATAVDPAGAVDALHRAVRGWRHKQRRQAIQKRGMETDWSWLEPARHHIDLYQEMLAHG
ncbi:MAG: glycogen/starch synthase [Actinomycetota bacterium]|nr:glycogen/starch synthase [Actinomycetota bacterium]